MIRDNCIIRIYIQAHVLSTYILYYIWTTVKLYENIQVHVLSTYIPQYYVTLYMIQYLSTYIPQYYVTLYDAIQNIQAHVLSTYIPCVKALGQYVFLALWRLTSKIPIVLYFPYKTYLVPHIVGSQSLVQDSAMPHAVWASRLHSIFPVHQLQRALTNRYIYIYV